jgi:nucleoid DNA-binding protein
MTNRTVIINTVTAQLKQLTAAGVRSSIKTDHVKMVIDLYEQEVLRQIVQGDLVFTRIAKYYTIQTEARNGKNPHTGATILIPAKNRVRMKVSAELMELLN